MRIASLRNGGVMGGWRVSRRVVRAVMRKVGFGAEVLVRRALKEALVVRLTRGVMVLRRVVKGSAVSVGMVVVMRVWASQSDRLSLS